MAGFGAIRRIAGINQPPWRGLVPLISHGMVRCNRYAALYATVPIRQTYLASGESFAWANCRIRISKAELTLTHCSPEVRPARSVRRLTDIASFPMILRCANFCRTYFKLLHRKLPSLLGRHSDAHIRHETLWCLFRLRFFAMTGAL